MTTCEPYTRVYVVAGNYEQFVEFCYERKTFPQNPRMVYVYHQDTLRGVRFTPGDEIVFVGTYYERPHWPDIRVYLNLTSRVSELVGWEHKEL